MVNAQLILAPVGAGKTEFVLNELQRHYTQNPFARIWVLLATQRQEVALRERLFRADGDDTYFNIEFFNFSTLYQRLLDMAGNPQRMMNKQGQAVLLRHLIHHLNLPVFESVAHTHGFVRIIEKWIEELKSNRVNADDYKRVASTPREHDLAQIYETYQHALIDHRLMDEEGQGWLAVEALQARPNLLSHARVDVLIVDGFDQFSHTQTDLLAHIAKQVPQLLITLTQVSGREATIGRRFSTAKTELEGAFDRLGEDLTITPIGVAPTTKHPDLSHLVHTIFSRGSKKGAITDGITFLEAPTLADETANVLRHVKQALLNGAKPDDILIAVRDWGNYRPHLSAYAEKYRLPMVLHYDEPLTKTPFVMTLTHLLDLAHANFPRRGVLDALRSPYINGAGLSSGDIDLLEAISEKQLVIHGREAWLSAITESTHTPKLDEEEGELSDFKILPEQAEYLQQALGTFFDTITPPAEVTLSEFIVWIETLIGTDPILDVTGDDDEPLDESNAPSLNMLTALRMGDSAWLWRDLLVIQAIKKCLRDLYVAHAQLRPIIGAEKPILWDDFYAQLGNSLMSGKTSPRPSRAGRILVTTATGGRGLPHAHVFILGLSDGIFPAPIPQDPLYLESERIRLNLALPQNPIKTQMEQRDDEGVFYELICLPSQSLTLSRPTLKDGKEWLPSPLWRGAVAVYENAPEIIAKHKIGVGKTVSLAQAVTVDEAFTALSIALSNSDEAMLDMGAWLIQTYPQQWERLRHHRTMELGRIGHGKNAYNGVLSSARLKEYVQNRLGKDYTWSATRLTDQGQCGFRFFAKHLLKLSERKEPEIDMDVLQRGSVLHAILEEVYKTIREQNLSITPQNTEEAHALLDDIGARVLKTAPHDFGFRPTALWEQEKANILQKLHQLIEEDFNPEKDTIAKKLGIDGTRTPYRLEASFGFDNHPLWLDLGDDVGEIRLRGKIDRMDTIGDAVVVMDYKSGSSEIKPQEIADGRNYQMLIYLQAARQIAKGYRVAGGFFWHLANASPKGFIHADDNEEILTSGMTHLTHQISASREGNFAIEPNKPQPNGLCSRYCEFGKLCRHYRGSQEDEDE
jgi:ATP-dependent helicase/DNAse subunit B